MLFLFGRFSIEGEKKKEKKIRLEPEAPGWFGTD